MSPEELLEYLLTEHESEFIEFKGSNFNPENTGELISALANGAVLEKKNEAYLVFGVNDERAVVGTSFDPDHQLHGQPYKNWIASNLSNCEALSYLSFNHPRGEVVIIVIPRAKVYPVKFKGVEYVRVGSSKKKLSEHPELARKLWEEILRVSFEDGNASDLIDEDRVFELLDVSPYFRLREAEIPTKRATIIGIMVNEGVLTRKLGKYFITNLGALLFAKDMSNFDSLLNRGVRLIKYRSNDKTVVERSFDGRRGYAIGVNDLINNTMLLLPSEEYLAGGVRRNRQIFPREAVRELTTNMLMHQDFSISGYAPRIEIYNDRVEFTNPGSPVIEVERFLDSNLSRNPKLAKLMRFMKLCEERGMGIDIVEANCEQNYLPSASISSSDGFTRITVFDHKSLRQFNSNERVNLVYMHCCLQYVKHAPMTNETLRSRFAEGILSSTVASRWINEAVDRGMIRPFDPDSSSRRHASYVPVWA
jgi:ATP-dependent DNA helicase RecG